MCKCQPHLSIDWWMDKGEVEHTFNGILTAIQKNEIMPFAAKWMDLGIIILSEVSQQRQISYNISYSLKKRCEWTYLQNRKKFTDLENEFMVMRGGKYGNRWGAWDCHFNFLL